MLDRMHLVDAGVMRRGRAEQGDAKGTRPPALSWAIVIVLAVVISGMALTPFVPAKDKFVPAIAAAIGFFVLWALVTKAAKIRG